MPHRDGEVFGHAVPDHAQHLGGVPVGEALVVDHDVRGEGGQAGRDGRGVQVVHVPDVVEFQNVPADLVEVDDA